MKRKINCIVSVPFRGFVIHNSKSRSGLQTRKGTVSVPFRGFVIHNQESRKTNIKEIFVSVPFRGFVIHNEKILSTILLWDTLFPSPFGVLSFIT